MLTVRLFFLVQPYAPSASGWFARLSQACGQFFGLLKSQPNLLNSGGAARIESDYTSHALPPPRPSRPTLPQRANIGRVLRPWQGHRYPHAGSPHPSVARSALPSPPVAATSQHLPFARKIPHFWVSLHHPRTKFTRVRNSYPKP